jgi:glycosyltransferase involved in cell wall biosynthesis
VRVLHITPYFAPAFAFGGPPRSILALCHAQLDAGVDVEVFTTTADGAHGLPSAPSGATYDGVRVRYFPTRALELLFWSPALARELTPAAERADVIHSHGLFNAPTWQAHHVSQQRRRPLIVSVRGMLERAARAHHGLRKRAAWSLFDKRVCGDAAVLHTTSDRESASVREAVSKTRIVQIPNAVDIAPDRVVSEDRAAIRRELGLGAHAPYVLYLGRLHPIKRLDLLGEAFAQLSTRHRDVSLVIAGEGAPSVRAAAEQALGPARQQTRWPGAVHDRRRDALLAEAAALVLCSDSENFGMSVAEALACGVVPVVTRTCPWSILEEARAGFWVQQTAAAIAEGLDRILSFPEAAGEMGARGRRLVAERFSRDVVGKAWAAEYARVAR